MTLSRRSLLRKAAGTGAALVFADVLGLTGDHGLFPLVRRAEAAGNARFFLYGLRPSHPALGPSLGVGAATSALALSPMGQQLAALPVRSPDGAKIALTSVVEDRFSSALVVSFVDTETGAITEDGSLDLSSLPTGTSLLVTPAFAADSQTLCLVLSITVPGPAVAGTKLDPVTGGLASVNGTTWTSHHALAYFDGNSFSGPHDLADAPSLARVNAFADDRDLFVWTIEEPAAVIRRLGRGAPIPDPQIAAFPLGSGTARFAAPSPGQWPVNDEPIVRLATGDIGRLVYARDLEVYSPTDGSFTTHAIPALADGLAKPAEATMESRHTGLLFIAKVGAGVAVLVDPRQGYRTTFDVRFPVPLYARSAPSRKAVLSAAEDTVYVLGGQEAGGIAAYDVASGSLKASYVNGQHFGGLHLLPNGEVLAVAPSSPNLSLLNANLEPVGRGDVDMHIAAIV